MRSHCWFGASGLRADGHRFRTMQMGLDRSEFVGKPVIGIVIPWAEINPRHTRLRTHARGRSSAVSGRRAALPGSCLRSRLPGQSGKRTTMMYCNLLVMETEELLRSHPTDGVALLGGCDKTTPALAMGATSKHLPAIFLPVPARC